MCRKTRRPPWSSCQDSSWGGFIVAPLIVLLYDRMFIHFSFSASLRNSMFLYGGFIFCVLFWMVVILNHDFVAMLDKEAGVGVMATYAVTQLEVIIHYLRLSLWPDVLILDYLWSDAELIDVIPELLVLMCLLLLTLGGYGRNRPLAFPALCFFIALIPSSSVIPIIDRAFEHRMYLPLTGVVTFVVIGVYGLGQAAIVRFSCSIGQRRLMVAFAISAVIVVSTVFFGLTSARNQDYQNSVNIWRDTVAKRPENVRAINNLAALMVHAKRFDEAEKLLQKALTIDADYYLTYINLAALQSQKKNLAAVTPLCQKAMELFDKDHYGYSCLGNLAHLDHRLEEAADYFTKAISRRPYHIDSLNEMAVVLLKLGRPDEAIPHLEKILKLRANDLSAHFNLARALLNAGRPADAIPHFRRILRAKPDFGLAHFYLAQSLQKEASLHLRVALQHRPGWSQVESLLEKIESIFREH